MLLGRAVGEFGQAGLTQDLVDEADTVGEVLLVELSGDVLEGELLLTESEDAFTGQGGAGGGAGCGVGKRKSGSSERRNREQRLRKEPGA